VISGGFMDIDVSVYDHEDREIYSMKREKDDVFGFESPETGTFRFCFSNAMSTVTTKKIFFDIFHDYLEDTPELLQFRHVDSLTSNVIDASWEVK
jgi:hypothetical protein